MKKYTNRGLKLTRSGFGDGLLEAAIENGRIVALTADLRDSLHMDAFADRFPERFVECGIAESNMIGVAAGLAIAGKIPFAGSFAEFISGRVYDQIRQEIALGQANVKIAASHAGLSAGEDGATHQAMEDVALMRALPGMVVLNPCDYTQTKAATLAAARYDGPVYLRFGRPVVPDFTPEDQEFEIGKALVLEEGRDVTLLATGHLVWEALEACRILEEKGVEAEVIDVATIKPLDKQTILSSLRKTGAAVVAEEHNLSGGLGELIAGLVVRTNPVPMEFVNGGDAFGQSGTAEELMSWAGLDAGHIVRAAEKVMSRRK